MTCHSQLELGLKNLTVVVVVVVEVAVAVVGIPHSSRHWLAIASNKRRMLLLFNMGYPKAFSPTFDKLAGFKRNKKGLRKWAHWKGIDF